MKTPAAKVEPLAPPRTLNKEFVSNSIAAVESAIAPALSMTSGALRDAAIKKRRAVAVPFNTVLLSGAFGETGIESLGAADAAESALPQSQYAYDLTLLSYFALLADARLPRPEVEACAAALGDRLLQSFEPSTAAATTSTTARPRLSDTLSEMRGLLQALRTVGYLKSFRVDDADADDALWAQNSDLSDTRLTIVLSETASLHAAIVLNGRAGASPELARPLLSALLRRRGAAIVEKDEYFLDDTYRSNPNEYRANQQVLTLTIKPSA